MVIQVLPLNALLTPYFPPSKSCSIGGLIYVEFCSFGPEVLQNQLICQFEVIYCFSHYRCRLCKSLWIIFHVAFRAIGWLAVEAVHCQPVLFDIY